MSESEILIEKRAPGLYVLHHRDQMMTVDAQSLLSLMDYGLHHARTLEQEADGNTQPSELEPHALGRYSVSKQQGNL